MIFKIHKQYRLPNFDYSSNNMYFITICTKNRDHYLGEISNFEMYYTEIGFEALNLIQSVSQKIHHLIIDEYVIMPNHIHLIIRIENNNHQEKFESIQGLQPLQQKSIASFINHFKGKLKRWCNDNNIPFEWQSRFHDRIIRDLNEYWSIKKYIQNNVSNWDTDVDNVKL